MSAQDTSPKLFQFGAFELDLLRGELRKKGVKVKLQDQPLKVLRLLLENRGEVVSREQLREHIWQANTFVEFDQGLYSAIARLRDTLGDTSDSPRFIETVARRGYRFIADVSVPDAAPYGAIPAKPLPEEQVRARAAVFRHSVVSLIAGLLGGALVLAFVLAFNVAGARDWLRGRAAIHSIAVLPLENLSGDPEQEYFADGMTDELITTLARLGDLRVVSRTSIMRYKKVSKPLADVGRELDVDAVVEGTVERSAGRVRIRVQLIQAATDRHLWAQTYDRELQDALLLQSDAARDIVREIQTTLAKPVQQFPAPRQVNAAAYEAYLKGLYFSNKQSPESIPRSLDYFQQAISLDPGYAAAYSGLADALLREVYLRTSPVEVLERAAPAARKSVELNPYSPEGHNSLGTIYEFNWDWAAAEKEYQRAIELDPNFAWGHQNYAVFLSLQGRTEQGFAEAQRSQELDPLSPFIRTTYCWNLLNARRYEEAIAKCQQALEFDPNYLQAHGTLMDIYNALHRENEAFEEHLKTSALYRATPAQLDALKHAFLRDGMKGVWRMDLERISKSANPDPFVLAHLASQLGETDRAMTWLERAYQAHHPRLEEIKEGSEFDNLRSDPRFVNMLRRLHLEN